MHDPIERVCVIGAGVIGSLFAGHLAEVADVSVLTRRREHADALNREGLRITGRSDVHARVTAASDPDELEPFDLGIVATKATGLEAAAASLEGRFPDATLMTTLNGLGAEEVVRAHGDWPLVWPCVQPETGSVRPAAARIAAVAPSIRPTRRRVGWGVEAPAAPKSRVMAVLTE